jgi:hypothetical protein
MWGAGSFLSLFPNHIQPFFAKLPTGSGKWLHLVTAQIPNILF